MPGKIFVNYRRDDDRSMAARVRDRLAQTFGGANVFMDVDNLMAGQRFDRELEKALAATDIFIAVIGPRWMDLYQQRHDAGERDYVHEEIAGALKRGITVIPVLIERAGLPRGEALPADIRELVLHQKHDVTHEHFGQNLAALADAIRFARKAGRAPMPMPTVRAGVFAWSVALLVTAAAGYSGAYYTGVPVPWPWTPPVQQGPSAAEIAAEKARLAALEIDRERQARTKAEADAAAVRRELEARQKAEEDRQRAAAETARQPRPSGVPGLVLVEGFAPKPGQTFRDCNDGCPEMVVVPAGSFTMGSNDYNDEKPPHLVTIRQPFAVGKFEVTFDEWAACVSGGGCTSNRSPDDRGWGKGRRPVIYVSWNDAKEYVTWLSRKTGKTYRLLSEAEWEYSARAKTTTRFSFGDGDAQLATYAWYTSNSGGRTHPVGEKSPNAFGLYDMHGNVMEWCEDTMQPNYQGAPTDGSAWTSGGTSSRVLRGGSWGYVPNFLRSADRRTGQPGSRIDFIGFRIARTL